MISPLAHIEPKAQIDSSCTIEPFAYIGADVKLGANCVVKSGAIIKGNTTLGEGCVVHSHAVIGGEPQDISFKQGGFSALEIGKNVTIREFVTINSGTHKGDGYTRIGDNCFIMAYVHIAHDCILANNIILANGVTLAGHVQIGSFSVIGGLTPVHQFVQIGEYCMLAGASALSQDLPHFCLAEGNRASVRSLNLVGLRRNFEPEMIGRLKAAFKELFRASEGNLTERASKLLAQSECDEVKKLCEFVIASKRGISIFNKGIDER